MGVPGGRWPASPLRFPRGGVAVPRSLPSLLPHKGDPEATTWARLVSRAAQGGRHGGQRKGGVVSRSPPWLTPRAPDDSPRGPRRPGCPSVSPRVPALASRAFAVCGRPTLAWPGDGLGQRVREAAADWDCPPARAEGCRLPAAPQDPPRGPLPPGRDLPRSVSPTCATSSSVKWGDGSCLQETLLVLRPALGEPPRPGPTPILEGVASSSLRPRDPPKRRMVGGRAPPQAGRTE